MNIRIGVYGLIYNEKQEFLIAKTRSKNRYIYNFVGGGLEDNESPEICLQREVQEEAGIFVETTRMQPIYFNKQLHKNQDYPSNNTINIYFKIDGTVAIDAIKINQKCEVSDLLWLDGDRFLQFGADKILSADVEFVNFLLKNKLFT